MRRLCRATIAFSWVGQKGHPGLDIGGAEGRARQQLDDNREGVVRKPVAGLVLGEVGCRRREGQRQPPPPAARKKRLSNEFYVWALDSSMRAGTNLGLKDFLPLRRARALQPGERRYFVDGHALDEDVPQGKRKRSCLIREGGPSGALELPTRCQDDLDDPELDRDLILALDQGSVGWQAAVWLFSHVGVSGAFFNDPWRRTWNDLRVSIGASGLWCIVLEMVVVLNHRSRPLGGAAFWTVTKERLEEMLRASDHTNPLFAMLYEDICADGGLGGSMMGTAEHMQEVWGKLSECQAFRQKGAYAKWGRWCSVFDVAVSYFQHFHARLLAMYAKAFREHWWPSLEESPLGSGVSERVSLGGGGHDKEEAAAVGGEQPKTVKQSDRDLKALRDASRDTRSTWHAASCRTSIR